jgi:hypothetical protein
MPSSPTGKNQKCYKAMVGCQGVAFLVMALRLPRQHLSIAMPKGTRVIQG